MPEALLGVEALGALDVGATALDFGLGADFITGAELGADLGGGLGADLIGGGAELGVGADLAVPGVDLSGLGAESFGGVSVGDLSGVGNAQFGSGFLGATPEMAATTPIGASTGFATPGAIISDVPLSGTGTFSSALDTGSLGVTGEADLSSMQDLMNQYGNVNINDAITNRLSTNVEIAQPNMGITPFSYGQDIPPEMIQDFPPANQPLQLTDRLSFGSGLTPPDFTGDILPSADQLQEMQFQQFDVTPNLQQNTLDTSILSNAPQSELRGTVDPFADFTKLENPNNFPGAFEQQTLQETFSDPKLLPSQAQDIFGTGTMGTTIGPEGQLPPGASFTTADFPVYNPSLQTQFEMVPMADNIDTGNFTDIPEPGVETALGPNPPTVDPLTGAPIPSQIMGDGLNTPINMLGGTTPGGGIGSDLVAGGGFTSLDPSGMFANPPVDAATGMTAGDVPFGTSGPASGGGGGGFTTPGSGPFGMSMAQALGGAGTLGMLGMSLANNGLISQGKTLSGANTAAINQAQFQINNALAGNITPSQQAQLDQQMAQAKAKLVAQFYAMGRDPNSDSSFLGAMQDIQQKILTQRQQFLDAAVQQGLQELQIADQGLYQAALLQVQQNTAFTNALSGALRAYAQLFSGQPSGGSTPGFTTQNL